jgi:DNA-directed RNA polymerase subunit beta
MKVKDFSRSKFSYNSTDLFSFQKQQWEWFWQEGLKKLFKEFSSIYDYTEKAFRVDFLDYNLGEPQYSDDFQAKENNASYEAPFFVKVRLNILEKKKEKEQKIFFTNFPLITDRNTFVVNGIEKVPLLQLIKSYGLFFTCNVVNEKKFFGAKIIPSEGSWLEIYTEPSGVIYVKIDKGKKIPVTFLLNVFGNFNNKQIESIFQDIDIGETRYIEKTLSKTPISNIEDIYLFIYHKMRPNSLATIKIAKQFMTQMFGDIRRYDLSQVGRWKFWQRLPQLQPKTKNPRITRKDRLLKTEDLIAIIREIIALNNNPQAMPDFVDHLINRRVRSGAELLLERLRSALSLMEKNIKNKMSIVDKDSVTLNQLINPSPFHFQVKSFFASSLTCQYMDEKNFLAEMEHRQRISLTGPGGLTRERAGLEARDIQPSFYGRICPIKTPEGQNVGMVNHLSTYARINQYGFITTPYYKVKDGKRTNSIEYLNAAEEERYNIAPADVLINNNNEIINKEVNVRKEGKIITVKKREVDYIDVSPAQILSFSAGLIPFLQNDEASRALMGTNMQCQAVPLIRPTAPLIMTGMEKEIVKVIKDRYQIVADVDGEVEEVDASHIKIKAKNSKKSKTYLLKNFVRTNAFTCYHEVPCVKKGQKIKTGDVIIKENSVDKGCLSLGRNVLVAFMPWKGFNFEDAIVLSERVVRDDVFTSISIHKFECDVRETKIGPEITTADIPNVSKEKLKNLDIDGIIREGVMVSPGDILVGKISPKGRDEMDLSPEEKLLRAIFQDKAQLIKDTSKILPHGEKGKVVSVKVFSRQDGYKLDYGIIKKIQIHVAQLRKAQIGDKFSGRHGNKGVASIILPIEKMPFLEDGTPVDVILNPAGVISRMNIGQLLETHLGLAAYKLGYHAITPGLFGATEMDIQTEFKKANLPLDGKAKVFVPDTGKPIFGRVVVGYIYLMKLDHMVEDKIHMRSTGPYSLVTQQPLGGRAQFGGQRFGEMEVWALEGYGAALNLYEMLTVKSDDIYGRKKVYELILQNKPINLFYSSSSSSYNLLVNKIRSLGLNIQIGKEKLKEAVQVTEKAEMAEQQEIKI